MQRTSQSATSPSGRDEQKLKELQKAWMDAVAEANKYVKPNEFPQIVENNGGEDLNANTADDETNYFYSFPENRLELWAYLESERFRTRSCASFTRNGMS